MRRSLKLAALGVAMAVSGVVAVAVIGASIDASNWRPTIARVMSDALGRDVRLEGPITVRLSLWPAVEARQLRIGSAADPSSPAAATIGELRLDADLLPIVRGEWRIRSVSARDVEVTLGGAGGAAPTSTRATESPPGASVAPTRRPVLDVHGVVVENLRLTLPASDGPRRIDVARLEAEARRGEPARLEGRGTAEGLPVSLLATGGPLDALGGADPWPFDLVLVAGGAALHAAGGLSGPLARPTVALSFGAGTDSPAPIAAFVGTGLPALGAMAASGRFEAGAGQYRLHDLNAAVGTSTMTGEIALDTRGARPKAVGRLRFPVFDALPFLAGSGNVQGEAPETLAQTFRDIESRPVRLPETMADADVQVDVVEVRGLPGDLRDVSFHLVNDGGRVEVPLKAMLAGARFEGAASFDGRADRARFKADLVARDSPLGGIAEVLAGAPYVDGTFGRFELALAAEGERVGDLFDDLDLRAALQDARLTYGNFPGGQPVRMTLTRAELAQPRGRGVTANLRGALLDKPFSGVFRAEPIHRVIREGRTTYTFDAQGSGTQAALSGVLGAAREASGSDVRFKLTAARARDLAPWLGLSSQSDVPVSAQGTLEIRSGGTSLSGGRLSVGRSRMTAELATARLAGRQVIKASLAADTLDVTELQRVLPPSAKSGNGLIDIPILPDRIDLADSDLDVRVKRVDGLPLAVSDITLDARVRGGSVNTAPYSVRIEGIPLRGAISLETRDKAPTAKVWLAGDDVDVGTWLRKLGMGNNIEVQAEALRLFLDIREGSFGRALEASSLVGNIGQGRLVIRDRNTKAALRVRVEEGEVRADPGEPLRVTLQGRVFRAPVTLRLVTGRLRQFLETTRRMPLTLDAEGGGAHLVISGEIAPRVAEPEVDLVVGLTGQNIGELRPLLRTSLPPWGPYAAAARLRISKWGYEVENLRMSIGESALEGRGALDTSKGRPRLDVALESDRIRLEDFPLEQWSPLDPKVGTVPKSMAAQVRETTAETAAEVEALLSADRLQSHDANLAVDVRRVVSGRDELGSGMLRARIEAGRAEVDPVVVNMPGGSARASLSYAPTPTDAAIGTRIRVDRFDYGVLARRIDPGTDLAGRFSLDVDISARAAKLAESLASGSGRIDFAVWPERMHAGVFDLWATNVLLAVLPAVDPSASRVNCAAGQFDLRDGELTSVRLFIDTTNTRAEGTARADFSEEKVEARIVARPKVPQFFSLATPVQVSGSFDDFSVGVRAADVLETVARWAASLVIVPFQKLTTRPPPSDGRDICASPLRTPQTP